jgi:hypothetical protein
MAARRDDIGGAAPVPATPASFGRTLGVAL